MRKASIRDLAAVIRSKNSGPYELTLDIIFPDRDTYEKVKASGVICPELIARLYRVPVEAVISCLAFDPALAIKATIVRPRAAGDIGETDVYGAQQHAPLLEIEIPWDEEV